MAAWPGRPRRGSEDGKLTAGPVGSPQFCRDREWQVAKQAEPPPHLFKSSQASSSVTLLDTVEVLTSKQLHLHLPMGHVIPKSSGLWRVFLGIPRGILAIGVGTEVIDGACFPS